MSIEIILPAPLHKPAAARPPVTHVWRKPPDRPVLGLIDNGKARAAELLDAIGRHLVAQGVVASHFVWRKNSAGKPITAAERENLLARAHLIVSGVGDCGACSSCSVHDAVLCSEQGAPSAVVITTPFQRLAQATAANLRVPGIPTMVIEHPIWTRDDAWLDDAAAQLCGALVAKLLQPAQQADRVAEAHSH